MEYLHTNCTQPQSIFREPSHRTCFESSFDPESGQFRGRAAHVFAMARRSIVEPGSSTPFSIVRHIAGCA